MAGTPLGIGNGPFDADQAELLGACYRHSRGPGRLAERIFGGCPGPDGFPRRRRAGRGRCGRGLPGGDGVVRLADRQRQAAGRETGRRSETTQGVGHPFLHERVQAWRPEEGQESAGGGEHARRGRAAGQGETVPRIPPRQAGAAIGRPPLLRARIGRRVVQGVLPDGQGLRPPPGGTRRGAAPAAADCDVDYDEAAAAWSAAVLASLGDARGPAQVEWRCSGGRHARGCRCQRVFPQPAVSRRSPGESQPQRPRLGQGDPACQAAAGRSGLEFEPGDALGIYPQNQPELVERLIEQMRWDPSEPVAGGKARAAAARGPAWSTTRSRS